MSRSVLTSTLITDVRQLGDWEGMDPTTGRVTDAFILRSLNQAITKTWLKVTRTGGQHKVTTTVTANTSSGVGAYALPSTFLWGLAVLLTSNGIERELTRIDMPHAADFTDSAGGAGVPQFFQFAGDNVEFVPIPDGAYPYRIRYVGVPTDLAAGSDPFDGILGFEQHAVALATKTVATREKEWDLVNQMRADVDKHEVEILDCVARRNPFPPSVVDVRGLQRRNRNGRRYWR